MIMTIHPIRLGTCEKHKISMIECYMLGDQCAVIAVVRHNIRCVTSTLSPNIGIYVYCRLFSYTEKLPALSPVCTNNIRYSLYKHNKVWNRIE